MLVKMVLKEGIPLFDAVEKLGIKVTTARFIINRFRKNGSFPRRKYKRSQQKNNQDLSQDIKIENAE